MKSTRPLRVALVGDCVMTRRVSHLRAPAFLRVGQLLRSADVAFGNCEVALPTPATRARHATAFALIGDPGIATELANCGLGLMSLANNHAADCGAVGVRETATHLQRAGIVVAGAGPDRTSAMAAHQCETPRGKTALIACVASRSAPEHDQKAPRRGALLNHLTIRTEGGAALREPEVRRLLAEIAAAGPTSDVVIISIHCHEDGDSHTKPPAFLRSLARRCLRAGASIIAIHGPHHIRGIELCHGGAVLYGMGSLFFQPEGVTTDRPGWLTLADWQGRGPQSQFALNVRRWLDQRHLWQGVVALADFDRGRLTGLTVHPLSLWPKTRRWQRGTPTLATGLEARQILTHLRKCSAAFGTAVRLVDCTAEVRITAGNRSLSKIPR